MTENSIAPITKVKTGKAAKQPYNEATGKYESIGNDSDGIEERRKEKEKAFRLMGIGK